MVSILKSIDCYTLKLIGYAKTVVFYACITINVYANNSSSVLVNKPVVCEVSNVANNCVISDPVKFDVVLDEDITHDDPRIKTIVYTNVANHGSLVKLGYCNANMQSLCKKIVSILKQQRVNVSEPQLLIPLRPDEHSFQYINVWILYPKILSNSVVKNQVVRESTYSLKGAE